MVVYKITNKVNGKVYIGQTTGNIVYRWRQHKCCKRKSPLYSSFKKHGTENFKIEVIATALKIEHLDTLEEALIKQYDCLYPKGYNLMATATVASHQRGKPSWNKGKKATAQAKLNQSLSHIGQIAWNKTKIQCIETRKIFDSIKLAAIAMNLQSGHICSVLKGNRKHTGGFTFRYKKEE